MLNIIETNAAPCNCTIRDNDLKVRLCVTHHRYHIRAKELVSVSAVIKSTWPIPADYSKADPAVLEHARDRGSRVDAYFTEYLNTGAVTIQAGEWTEVLDLLEKLVVWWDANLSFRSSQAKSQVILHDDRIAGTCDVLAAFGLYDLKTTYNIESTYHLQVGAYADLYLSMTGQEPPEIGIIHVTRRYAQPKLIPLDLQQCLHDWRVLRAMYELVQRKTT